VRRYASISVLRRAVGASAECTSSVHHQSDRGMRRQRWREGSRSEHRIAPHRVGRDRRGLGCQVHDKLVHPLYFASRGKRLRYPLSSGTPLWSHFSASFRCDFRRPRAETSLESFNARHAVTLTTASDACQIFAAHTRIVSGTQIRLNCRKSVRHFKAAVISDFESSQPSHAAGLSASLLVPAGGVFRPAMPDRWS
jgi:hypothetical protein